MGPGNQLAAHKLFPAPLGSLVRQHDVISVGLDARFGNVVERCLFLRTRVVNACYRFARAIGNEKKRDPRALRGFRKLQHARYWRCGSGGAPGFEFPVGERSLEFDLKIDMADNGFIDVEYDCGR